MKSRVEIKDRAKNYLKFDYGGILGEYLLIIAASYVISYVLSFAMIPSFTLFNPFSGKFLFAPYMLFSVVAGFLPLLLTAPLLVGYHERLKLLWWGQKKQTFFSGFVGGMYWRSVLSYLLTSIFTFLWSLLFVIPGIVKGIAYSMTPFIISDSQNITALEAINISKKMTYGYKMDIFVFYLSYIGWMLLSMLTFGLLAVFYAEPYRYTAFAGYYTELKKNALQNGVLTLKDFGYGD